jgi:acetyl-CoA C-acetyltransferase
LAQHLDLPLAKINYWGGNLAYGHPYGASGAINFNHLISAMEATQAQRGIVSIAAAGGMGVSLAIEAV